MEIEKSSVNKIILYKHISDNISIIGLEWGLIGGLAGTMVMDLILMCFLSASGMPALSCFTIVGETLAHLFSWQNMDSSSIIQLGLAMHYSIGPIVGVLFGLLVANWKAMRVNSLQRSILFAIIFIEILSQPLLAISPILLKMTRNTILLWYAGSSVMHLIAGIVLGSIVYYGFRLSKEGNNKLA